MSTFLIRAMQSEDISSLAVWIPSIPLWERYGVTSVKIARQFEEALINNDWLLVADVDGVVAGFAWCLPRGAFGRSVYLRLIGVHPDYAGLSIGTGLLEAMEAMASEHQQTMFLLVSHFNTDAQRFYQRQGYQQVGAIPDFVLPDVTEYIYWKNIP